MGGLHKGDLRSLCELGKFADAQPLSILSFACARALHICTQTHDAAASRMAPLYHVWLALRLLAPPPTLLMNTMQRISKPLHRASPRARRAVCCAAVAVARAVMQRTSGLLHHALLAPLHCSRPCRARHSRAPLLAPPLPLPSRRAPLLVPPLPLPSRSMPRAPLIAPLIAPSIEDAADRVIGCILLSRAVARRPQLLPPCALCSSTRGECPPNGPLMLAANHARTALTCPHTMQRHPVNRHHRATRTIASHMPAACRRRRYAAVTCPPLVAAAITPPSHRRRRVAAVASPSRRRR